MGVVLWGLWLFFLTVSLPVAAQSDTVVLPRAVVEAQRPRSIDVLPVQELRGRSLERLQSHSVADAVRFFSGVQLKDYGGAGGLKTINVRGMGTQHTGVYYDGLALDNAQNGQVDLGRFSLDDLYALTLYNGQRSRLLQPARCFGAASSLFLESRVPSFAEGQRRRLRVTLRAGSFGTLRPAVVFERRLSRAVCASFSAEYMHTDGRYRFHYRKEGGYDTTAVRRNSDLDAFRAEAGLYGATERDDWRVKVYTYASRRGLPGAVVRGQFAHQDRQRDANLFVQSRWLHRVNKSYAVLTSAKLAYDALRYRTDPVRDPGTMFVDNRFRQTESYLSSAHKLTVNRHVELSAAADWQYNCVNSNQVGFVRPSRHTLYGALAANVGYGTARLHASLLATGAFDRTAAGSETHNRRQLSPAVVLSVRPRASSPLSLRAFYKHGFRLPTLNDLYYTIVGRADLRPERLDQVDVGATWGVARERGLLRGLELSIDAYAARVRDKIVAMPTANMFRWTMMNLGRVSLAGIDAAAEAVLAVGGAVFDGRATYAFARAVDVTSRDDAFRGDQIPYIPRHSGSLTLGVAWRAIDAHYSFIYTGERYAQRANLPENREPAWYTSDLALTLRLAAWRLSAELNNVFNQQYDVVRGYPMPGRHFLFSCSLSL